MIPRLLRLLVPVGVVAALSYGLAAWVSDGGADAGAGRPAGDGELAASAPATTVAPSGPPSPAQPAASSNAPAAPAGTPSAPAVPRRAGGALVPVPGRAAAPAGRGTVVRYVVEVERGLPVDPVEFAGWVHATLNDPRSWGRGGSVYRFQRVPSGPARLRVALESPTLVDRMCAPLHTGGRLSCWQGGRAHLNAVRWVQGVPHYGGDLAAYRRYMVNHEVGHGLGHGHERCPGAGAPAPVMVQQTKSLDGCRPNPWPHPG